MRKKILAPVLAVMLAVSPIGTIKSMAEENVVSDTAIPAENIYIEQQAGGTCTLASAVMMLRARMYLSGNYLWPFVTEDSVRPAAWMEGVGLYHGWSYEIDGSTINVARAETAGMTAEALKALLDIHPEGVEIYDRGDEEHAPHAVYVTDYEGDTFYCADPAPTYSGRRMPLAESLIGARYDGTQETVLGTIDAYWYISSYSITAAENQEDTNITRREAVMSLWKASGCPEPYNEHNKFVDISKDDAAYEAVLWAAEMGIMDREDSVQFAPDENVTREMLCGIGMEILPEDSFEADTPMTK